MGSALLSLCAGLQCPGVVHACGIRSPMVYASQVAPVPPWSGVTCCYILVSSSS